MSLGRVFRDFIGITDAERAYYTLFPDQLPAGKYRSDKWRMCYHGHRNNGIDDNEAAIRANRECGDVRDWNHP